MLALFSLGMLTTHANTKGVWIGVVAGFWTVTWISIGALVHPPKYPTQPMSISGCPSNFSNVNMSYIEPAQRVQHSSVYEVSFFWYGLIGFVITYIIGYLASYIFKKHHTERIDPALLFDYSKLSTYFGRGTKTSGNTSLEGCHSTEADESTPFISSSGTQ